RGLRQRGLPVRIGYLPSGLHHARHRRPFERAARWAPYGHNFGEGLERQPGNEILAVYSGRYGASEIAEAQNTRSGRWARLPRGPGQFRRQERRWSGIAEIAEQLSLGTGEGFIRSPLLSCKLPNARPTIPRAGELT